MLFAWPAAAAAVTSPFPTDTVSPTAGGVGATITVLSVTVCKLPTGVTGAPLAVVSLTQGSRVIAHARFTVSSSGTWHGVLVVRSTARPGTATVNVFCIASAQAEGALFQYRTVRFTVLGLAHTGADGLLVAVGAGVLLVVVGGVLMLVSRRRGAPTR